MTDITNLKTPKVLTYSEWCRLVNLWNDKFHVFRNINIYKQSIVQSIMDQDPHFDISDIDVTKTKMRMKMTDQNPEICITVTETHGAINEIHGVVRHYTKYIKDEEINYILNIMRRDHLTSLGMR
jgi:hypothetical protein